MEERMACHNCQKYDVVNKITGSKEIPVLKSFGVYVHHGCQKCYVCNKGAYMTTEYVQKPCGAYKVEKKIVFVTSTGLHIKCPTTNDIILTTDEIHQQDHVSIQMDFP